MNSYTKNVLRFTSKSILLYLGIVVPDGRTDILRHKDFEDEIIVSNEMMLKVKKVEILLSTGNIQPVNVEYEVYYGGKLAYTCSYSINMHNNRCFWNSDVKIKNAEARNEIKPARTIELEMWANAQFSKHYDDTHHCININNRDTL